MSPVKLELRKMMKEFYNPSTGEVVLVELPPLKYIMVDGSEEPRGGSFQQAMSALYNIACTMKFQAKRLLKKDYDLMTIEGL